MRISIQSRLKYASRGPCSLLLQIEAAADDAQRIEASDLYVTANPDWHVVSGEEGIGQRRWCTVTDVFDCTYTAQVQVDRKDVGLAQLEQTPLHLLPSDVTKFLMPSRYCHPEAFLDVVPKEFGNLTGGPLVAAMADWIADHFTYDNGISTGLTSATESFAARAGVCRDYAHVLIAMARAVGIPARMVSVYAPDVKPQDFHAVVEVYLASGWCLVDPTRMARAPEMVRIGVGRDAADVSFMTSYGWMELIEQSVQVSRED